MDTTENHTVESESIACAIEVTPEGLVIFIPLDDMRRFVTEASEARSRTNLS